MSMAINAQQVTIPSNGNAVSVPLVLTGDEGEVTISLRNTGTVTVLVGASGSIVFPLNAGEVLGFTTDVNSLLYAEVQTAGTAGQLTVIAF
jgi:hypothetical protein